MKMQVKQKGLAAFVAMETGQLGAVFEDFIEFEIENENEKEALERKYAGSEFNRFNQLVMAFGKQQRQKTQLKRSQNGTFSY